MSLAAVVHRIAIDPEFAAQMRADSLSSLKAAGFAIDQGESAALSAALNSNSDVEQPDGAARPAAPLEPMLFPYDIWPAHFTPSLYDQSHHLWADVLGDVNYGTWMDQALPQQPAAQTLAWTDLPSLCCQAAGGDARHTREITVAWSLLAAACHLLDDIADGDRPDAWWVGVGPGVGAYVSAGLTANAWHALNGLQPGKLPETTRQEVIGDFHKTYLEVCAGQCRDLMKAEPTLAECWQIAEMKSARYFALACRAGARLATADPTAIARFSSFGHCLGLLLQISNDVSGVWRARGLKSDLAAGRRWSLPVAYAMAVAPANVQAHLRECLKRAPVETRAEEEARAMIENMGAGLYLAAEAIRIQREAERTLTLIRPPEPAGDALAAILASVSPRSEQGTNCHERLHAQALVE